MSCQPKPADHIMGISGDRAPKADDKIEWKGDGSYAFPTDCKVLPAPLTSDPDKFAKEVGQFIKKTDHRSMNERDARDPTRDPRREYGGLGDVAGYEPLRRILNMAYDQSATGKGSSRHGRGKAFKDQPIMAIARMVGHGGHAYQICKKAQEASGMADRHEHSAAKAELLGVIVYAAAAVLLLEEMDKTNV